jgi:hypothetical protein
MAPARALLVAVFCASAFLSTASARPDASRLIDRTFSCVRTYKED